MTRSLRMFPSRGDEWYAAGVRFACTCSGKCCLVHGDYAYVYMTREEEVAIAAHEDLSLREFRRRHTSRTSAGDRTLRFPDGQCTFLRQGQCSIYEVRPQQCRSWPFWPENMDRRVWDEEIASFCPGIGRGRLYSADEIRAVLEGRAQVSENGEGA